MAALIKTTQLKICQNYTPKYRAAIRNHYALMNSSFPDVEKLGKIISQLAQIQTGIEPPKESIELGKLENIHGYLNKLLDAYKYKLYYKEDDSQ